MTSMLYPKTTKSRRVLSLNGMWKIFFDFEKEGEKRKFENGIPGEEWIPVPSSFADLYTDKKIREFCGDIWYETKVDIPQEWIGMRLEIRFAAVTHRAEVYWNGEKAASHEGGFTPFCADITKFVKTEGENLLVIKVNNELSAVSLPNGTTKTLQNGLKMAVPYFDFFNYSGIQRNVDLVATPETRVVDYDLSYVLKEKDVLVAYRATVEGMDNGYCVRLEINDRDGQQAAASWGMEGTLKIENVRLWQVRNPYLYQFIWKIMDGETVIDEYRDEIGIRTVGISGTDILINGKPVYLKGFGRHEDSPVNGRTPNPCFMKRDFELMKWTGANSFRTSHYPYAEEMYQIADREGFLIIDEVAAVGFVKRSGMQMFTDAGRGVKPESFFAAPSTAQLLENHKNALRELIQRDKNHASVIAWSLFNEPESVTEEASVYFREIFAEAGKLDPQKRPRTFAMELSSGPDDKICHRYCDFWCMNRYYGWYVKGGYEIEDAMNAFREEKDRWSQQIPLKPMVFTEYGTDTLASEHKLPSVMWSQEYQSEYLRRYHEIFDSYPFVKGEQIWNFADFQTVEGIARVNGNKKGVFTRDRQPKDSAFLLKERWDSLPADHKAVTG